MNAKDARDLTRATDPDQETFYKDKPCDKTDLAFCSDVFDDTVKKAIKDYFDSPKLGRGSLSAYFAAQWNNHTLKEYAISRGFKIHCCNNGTSLMITWDI